MSVLISNDAELDTLLDAQEVEHICAFVLATEGVKREVEISLSYVDEDEMHELNHEWRGIDRTTDVLSFECDSAFDEDIPADEIVVVGDSYDKDIVPATRIGCQTIWLKSIGWSAYKRNETADIVLSDFTEIKQVFAL